MAQTGYTPIQLYYSTTTSNVPSAGNLASGELAINITDGKLFYKDNGGVVRVIAQTSSVTNVASISFGTTGLTPSTATTGAVTVAGTLATTNGGTGLTSFTANRVFYASSTSAIGQSANLTFDGTTLTAANFTDSSLTSGRVTYAGTGGNLTDSAALTFNGSTLATSSANASFLSGSATTAGVITSGAAGSQGVIQFGSSQTTFNIQGGPDYLGMIYNIASALSHQWAIGGSEQARLTSTGLGIGTSSPGYKVSAVVTSGADAFFADGNGQAFSGYRIRAGAGGQQWAFRGGTSTMALSDVTAGVDRMQIDSSGNLGLGVTPTNVVGTRKLEIGGTTNAAVVLSTNSSNAAARNWATAANFNAFGDYVFLQSNALGGDPTTAGTTRMTLDASGNLGIGTSSPASTLDVRTSTGATIIAGRTSNVGATSVPGVLNFTAPNASGSARTWAGIRSVVGTATTGSESSSIIFSNQVAGAYTDTLTLDTSGNLGLGVTPSAWASNWKAFQIGSRSLAQTGSGAGDWTMAFNAVFDSTDSRWEYQYTGDSAVRYSQTGAGIHAWYTAGSGTAGNAISFTQAMTLDASGRLMVGTTTPDTLTGGLTLSASANNTDTTQAYLSEIFAIKNTDRTTNNLTAMYFDGLSSGGSVRGLGAIGMQTTSWTDGAINSNMLFWTSGSGTVAERARITSGGNVSIGGSADRGTTVGSAALQLFNGTAPAGTLTNGVSLYSQSGDLRFMDAAGNAYPVGFRNIPQSGSAKTGSYTLATTDVGEYIQVGSGGSITIPDATFATGDVVSVFNNTTGNITITCSITTAYIAGTDSDKATMTLATRGVATILFISSTVCVVTGNVT